MPVLVQFSPRCQNLSEVILFIPLSSDMSSASSGPGDRVGAGVSYSEIHCLYLVHGHLSEDLFP